MLRPMTQDEHAKYLEQAIRDYAQDKVENGTWAENEALERSRKAFADLLPDGVTTPNNYLFSIVDESNTSVGMIWFAVMNQASQPLAFVYDFVVFEEHRRKGYGSKAFLALEDKVRELGVHKIALHVFGHNKEAWRLYERLGYQITDVSMAKDI